MIVLDTHVWIWHVQGDTRLDPEQQELIQTCEPDGLGISAISLWEIAKAVELKGLSLPVPIKDWFSIALAYPGIVLLPLTPRIAIESTHLPGAFHKDPSDQIIVATARVYDCPLLTYDSKILGYKHVKFLN